MEMDEAQEEHTAEALAEKKGREKEGACPHLSAPLLLCACAEPPQTSPTRSGHYSYLSPAHRCSWNQGHLLSSRTRWPRCCPSSREQLQRITLSWAASPATCPRQACSSGSRTRRYRKLSEE